MQMFLIRNFEKQTFDYVSMYKISGLMVAFLVLGSCNNKPMATID